jgi:hypothetical protein
MAGKGGAREGAGRKSNAEKYGVQIAEYTDRCAEFLDDAQEKLRELIEGATRSECKRARAGTVTRKDVVRDEDRRGADDQPAPRSPGDRMPHRPGLRPADPFRGAGP